MSKNVKRVMTVKELKRVIENLEDDVSIKFMHAQDMAICADVIWIDQTYYKNDDGVFQVDSITFAADVLAEEED